VVPIPFHPLGSFGSKRKFPRKEKDPKEGKRVAGIPESYRSHLIYQVLQGVRFSRFLREKYGLTIEDYEQLGEERRREIWEEFLRYCGKK